ncbi:ABC-type amino acid transport substrate-binding protein [Bradyrhizobium sp. GM7.3]
MGSTTRKLLVMLFTTAATSFGALAQSQDPLLASIKEARQVKVALGAATPLLSVSPDGKATGYTVDLLDIVLKDWGLPSLAPVLTAWDSHVPALQARQLDAMGIASVTEEACKALWQFQRPISSAMTYFLFGPEIRSMWRASRKLRKIRRSSWR